MQDFPPPLLRSLAQLTAAVQRLRAGDFTERLPELDMPAEVAALARALNALADALQQREAERQQIEERFRAAFESSAIGMGLLTLDGKILAVNAAVCQMSGFTEEELRGRNGRENVYPPDAEVGMDLFVEMLAGKRGYYSVERLHRVRPERAVGERKNMMPKRVLRCSTSTRVFTKLSPPAPPTPSTARASMAATCVSTASPTWTISTT